MILYLRINVAIAVSYLFFRAMRSLTAKYAGSRWLLRLAQGALVAAILAPLLLAALPERSLPRFEWRVPEPLAEMSSRVFNAPPARRNASGDEAKPVEKQRGALPSAKDALTWLFAIGLILSALRLGRRVRSLLDLLAAAAPIRRHGRTIIAVSDAASVPFSTAIDGKRWVVLPAAIVAAPRDLHIAVSHELQHHRQGDTAWALAVEVITVWFYVNPAIYAWRKLIMELQEFSCDESLIGRKGISSHEYGCCLLRVAEAALVARQNAPHAALGSKAVQAGTACMAEGSGNPQYFKSFLKRRIDMLFQKSPIRPSAKARLVGGTLIGLMSAAIAYGAQQTLAPAGADQSNPGSAAIDPIVQPIAETALRDAVGIFHAEGGFVLVSEPTTGRVLAVANVLSAKKIPGRWSLSQRLEPASAAKGIVAAAAVEKGLTTVSHTFDCENGEMTIGGNIYRDWMPFKTLTTTDTVVHSSNLCGIKVARTLGREKLLRAFADFGFGPGGTASEFPEARSGRIPGREGISDDEYVATFGIGEGGMQITPLEMLLAYGTIANGGNLMKPLAADAPDASASIVRRVLSEGTAADMRKVLVEVVARGTGKLARSPLYTTAGKTSTGHNPELAGQPAAFAPGTNIAGFVGFAPAEHPRLVIYVGLYFGADRKAHGGGHAAPVFREIAEKALTAMKVKPDRG